MPENTQPDHPEQQRAPGAASHPDNESPAEERAGAQGPPQATAPNDAAPGDLGPETDTGDAAATDDTGGQEAERDESGVTETVTDYQRTAEGHRVTRRTVRRREVSEDTEETITETYPVPHQPPTPTGHPAPVG